MRYFGRLKNIYSNQKVGDIYYRYYTRFISAPITAMLSFTPVTPNMATLSMFFFGVLGAVFLSLGNAFSYILGGCCFQLLIIADTVDGELARFHGTSSLFGDYFDRLAHYATNPLCIIGIGLSLYSNFHEIGFLYFAAFAMICYLLDDISRDLLISCGLSKEETRKIGKTAMAVMPKSRIKIFFFNTGSNTAFFHLIVLAAVADIILINVVNLQKDLFVSHTYMLYFLILTIMKFFFRIPLIWKLKST
jgi:phosphatidylglycerophosphate synthase